MTTASEMQAKVTKTVTNMGRLDDFVNGSAVSTVTLDGPVDVPTLQKFIADLGQQVEDGLADATIEGFPGLATAIAGKADAVHTHAIANITGLQAALDEVAAAVTLTALAGVTPVVGQLRYVMTGAALGFWRCVAGSAPSDTLNGIYKASSTAGYHWARIWDGINPRPEWWGAVINDSGTDCYAAIQACLAVTNRMTLSNGVYTSSRGIAVPDYAVIDGPGPLHCIINVAHATDHLLSQRGVSGSGVYKGGAVIRNIAVKRTVTPTTPANAANDIIQGHGLHFYMVSNPIVENVYTYDNLVECYVGTVLAGHIDNVRSIRETGTSSDRWTGLWVDGVTNGGSFGGPSPNPSTRMSKLHMKALAAITESYNYNLKGPLQDLWITDFEASGHGNIELLIDGNNAPCGDVHLVRPVLDGYGVFGLYAEDVPLGSSIDIDGGWIAPKAGATSSGAKFLRCHGITMRGTKGDGGQQPGLRFLDIEDCTMLDIDVRSVDFQYPLYADNMIACDVKVKGYKNIGGGGNAADFATIVGGARSTVTIGGTAASQIWVTGIKADSTASGMTFNISSLATGTATTPIQVNGVAITTQGNVGGHVILNPGAGPML